MPITRASARTAILSAVQATTGVIETGRLFEKLTEAGALPSGCSAEVFDDLLRELQLEGALSINGAQVSKS